MSLLTSRRGTIGARSTGSEPPSFDPVGDVSWTDVMFAEGAEMAALGYGDGDPVSAWPSESSARELTNLTYGTPTFRSAGIGGQPAVEFDGNDALLTSTFSSVTQSHFFMVVQLVTVDGTSRTIVAGDTFNNHTLAYNTSSYRAYAGSSVGTWGTPDTDPHAIEARFNDPTLNEALYIDGTLIGSGSLGSDPYQRIRLGVNSSGSGHLIGKVAFLGRKTSPLTVDERAGLLGWSQSHYGTP